MIRLYGIAMSLAKVLLLVANSSRLVRILSEESKIRKFIEGQKDVLEKSEGASPYPPHTIWVHASSLGEYGVARPVIQKLRAAGHYIVLTFFSSTGYDALTTNSDNRKEVDKVLYLPLDTAHNAKTFIENIRPEKAVFVISELWPNHLRQLKLHNIPTYLISAKVTSRSAAMRWYGHLFRDALRSFSSIMVMDRTSEALLHRKGIHSVVKTGDPLFDNARCVARQDYHDEIIENFCRDNDVFIAGSISDSHDLELVSHVANANPDTRCIFVPHEIREDDLAKVRASVKGRSVLYSECAADTDFAGTQVLVIDFLGALSRIYRFCAYAYVGGGFTHFLHSVIEPVVYGLPVSFGPNIYRKNTPQELIDMGVGRKVTSCEEIEAWFKDVHGNKPLLKRVSHKAIGYSEHNTGAADVVFKIIEGKCTH